ncbi:hypothetical protein [Sphingomonas japonica]
MTMLAAAAVIQIAAPAAHAGQATTVQQDFDSAARLTDAREWAPALAAWEALERRVAKSPRNLALVRVRKSTVLLGLDRRDEAAASAQAGLATMPETDATLQRDRYDGQIVLARIATSALDYASANEHFAAARKIAADPTERLASWWGVVETGTFVDPDAALAVDGEFPALFGNTEISDTLRGQIMTTRAQLYLNAGDVEKARAMSRDAVKALGGLTSKTDLVDVSARSLAGLAALRAGDRDDARRYLAMTGAGRATQGRFSAPAEMASPSCGGDTGLQPDDVAVIEFSVGDDGSVIDSSPIWSSRKGDAALAFARAARDWSWTPGEFAKLPSFFRSRVRVEMRCSTAFQRPSLQGYSSDALAAWLGSRGVTASFGDSGQARLAAQLRERLGALDANGPAAGVAAVPVLYALATNAVTPRDESHGWATRMSAILEREEAPPMARLAADQVMWATAEADRNQSRQYRAALTAALSDPLYAADPEARATIALMIADAARGDDRTVRTYARRVADDAALPANHPLKVGALIRIASLDFQQGDVAAARTAFERSGLGAEQCALLDAVPQMRRTNSNSSDFPREAMYWRMEGWTRVQYDIAADGKTQNARTVLAYPPFVFSESGAEVVSGAQFEASFRPGNTLGCGGTISGVNFQLPS